MCCFFLCLDQPLIQISPLFWLDQIVVKHSSFLISNFHGSRKFSTPRSIWRHFRPYVVRRHLKGVKNSFMLFLKL